MVLGVERPEDLGVRADGRRGLAEWVGVVTGVVGVVLAPDHPLKGVGERVDIRDIINTVCNFFDTSQDAWISNHTEKIFLLCFSNLCM